MKIVAPKAKANTMPNCTRTIIALAMSAVPVIANAQDDLKDYSGSYMCRPIGTAGIGYDKQSEEWRATTFDTSEWQHFIKFAALEDQAAGKAHKPEYRMYEVSLNRADLPGLEPTKCVNDILPGQKPGTVVMFIASVSCKGQEGTMSFNFENMRYQVISDSSYLYDLPGLSSYVQVGTCVRLD